MLASAMFVALVIATVLIGRLIASGTTGPGPAADDRQAVRADVQLLFTESRESTVTVDGVVVGGEPVLPAGVPLTLSVETPVSAPLATVVTSTLDRWALEGRVVDLELRALSPGITVRLSDGTSTVSLDVAKARLG